MRVTCVYTALTAAHTRTFVSLVDIAFQILQVVQINLPHLCMATFSNNHHPLIYHGTCLCSFNARDSYSDCTLFGVSRVSIVLATNFEIGRFFVCPLRGNSSGNQTPQGREDVRLKFFFTTDDAPVWDAADSPPKPSGSIYALARPKIWRDKRRQVCLQDMRRNHTVSVSHLPPTIQLKIFKQNASGPAPCCNCLLSAVGYQ